MRLLWLVSLGMGVHMNAMQKITLEELKERAKKVEIVFNNHPDDTSIILNGRLAVITPGCVNVTIKGVTDVTLKRASQELALRVWLIGELKKLKVLPSKEWLVRAMSMKLLQSQDLCLTG